MMQRVGGCCAHSAIGVMVAIWMFCAVSFFASAFFLRLLFLRLLFLRLLFFLNLQLGVDIFFYQASLLVGPKSRHNIFFNGEFSLQHTG